MTLGTLLRQLRKDRGWTQGQLALRSGIDQSHLSKIERDVHDSVNAHVLARLAEALEVSVDYLCEEAGWLTGRPHPKELALAEYNLIETIRLVTSPGVRHKVLEQLTWIAESVVKAEKTQQLEELNSVRKAAEHRAPYQEDQ